jgi:hypothetical protein
VVIVVPDRDEHYVKYRVFHEPPANVDVGHPVPINAEFLVEPANASGIETWETLDEIEGTFFVLRPENDNYARIAMAAYAYACRQEFPHLAVDIIQMIEGIEWEEATGQYRGDLPLVEDDYMEPSGDQLSGNVIEMLKKRANHGED